MIQNIIAPYIEDVNVKAKKSRGDAVSPPLLPSCAERFSRAHFVRVAVAVSPSQPTAAPSASAMARTGR